MSFDLSNIFSADSSEKNKEIISDSLKISDNILKFENLTIQLSNVSMIESGVKQFQMPWKSIGICVIAFMIMLVSYTVFLLFLISLIVMFLSAYYTWCVFKNYVNGRNYLMFFLNSGSYYSLYFKNVKFLEEIKTTVEEAFNNKKMNVTYNLKNAQITHTENNVSGDGKVSVNIGTQGNVMVDQSTKNSNDTNNYANSNNTVTGNYHVEGNTTIETQRTVSQFLAEYNCSWTDIANELEVTLAKISDNSQEKRIAQEMLMAAKNRDENSFLNIFKNNKSILRELFVNTTSSLAGGLLVQLTMHLIGK